MKATGVDQATIRGIIERLKDRDLVALSKDSEDGWKVIVSLTAGGTDLLERMIPHAREALARVPMSVPNSAESFNSEPAVSISELFSTLSRRCAENTRPKPSDGLPSQADARHHRPQPTMTRILIGPPMPKLANVGTRQLERYGQCLHLSTSDGNLWQRRNQRRRSYDIHGRVIMCHPQVDLPVSTFPA